jgi:hypothetical protein
MRQRTRAAATETLRLNELLDPDPGVGTWQKAFAPGPPTS